MDLQSSTSILSTLENNLNHRIKIINEVNQRLLTTKKALDSFISVSNQSESVFIPESSVNVPNGSSCLPVNEVVSETTDLDEILRKAKLIGTSQPKTDSDKEPRRNKSMKLSEYLSVSEKETNANIPKPPVPTGRSVSSDPSTQARRNAQGYHTRVTSAARTTSRTSNNGQQNISGSESTTTATSNLPTSSNTVDKSGLVNDNYDVRADINEQIKYHCSHKPVNIYSELCPDREMYIFECKTLSEVTKRTTHSHSIPYQVMAPSLLLSEQSNANCSSSNNAQRHSSHTLSEFTIKLKNAFTKLNTTFEHHLKMRLSRISLSQLTSTDKEEILTLWLKGRKLIDLYEHYCFRLLQRQLRANDRMITCLCTACMTNARNDSDLSDLVASLVLNMSYYCPLSVPATNSTSILSKPVLVESRIKKKSNGGAFSEYSDRLEEEQMLQEQTEQFERNRAPMDTPQQMHHKWHMTAKDNVRDFHDIFDSNVMYLCESAVGQYELKPLMQQLRHCVSNNNNNNQSASTMSTTSPRSHNGSINSATTVDEWQDALKKYRIVHSILVEGGENSQKVVFVNKDDII